MIKALSALFFIVTLLAGCASQRLIDSQVNAFAPQSIATGSRYRFERLPSQQADAQAQDQLEAITEAALTEVGLLRDDTAPRYTVQVSATQRVQDLVLDRPTLGWSLGWMFGNGGILMGSDAGFPGWNRQTNYWREVGLIVRDTSTQSVVYETRATHDGPWSDTERILPALLQAALKGFPNPPSGVRRVDIEIPR